MKKMFFIAPIAIILFSSCVTRRYIYAPSAPNIAYFHQKGDSKIAGFYSGSGGGRGTINSQEHYKHSDGFDVQGAYAISDHWALTGAYFYRSERDVEVAGTIFGTSDVSYKRNLAELGAGYFVPMNSSGTVTFNVYGSLGAGKFSLKETGLKDGDDYSRFYDVKVIKWFLQPSINFMPGKYFRASFYFKPTIVHYGRDNSDYLPDEYAYFGYGNINNHSLRFFELGYDLQLGVPKVPWLFIEHSVSGVLRSSYLEYGKLISRGANASIGLSLNFARMTKK